MSECVVVPPVAGDASSLLPHCCDMPSLEKLWYEPSFQGSPKLDALYTLLFFRNVRIEELLIRGLAPNPNLVFVEGEDENERRREMENRLGQEPSPEDYALLHRCRIGVLDMHRHSYSWFPEIA
ncbi:uncharacterized protein PHACADRAFT_262477, partial [Phanerochaete carnosa HHB-10118-sp]